MIQVSIGAASLARGEPIVVSVSGVPHEDYEHIQADFVEAGVLNRSHAIGTGVDAAPDADGRVTISVNTDSLPPGFYELALIRLHSRVNTDAVEQIDYRAGKEFPRQFCEVRPPGVGPRPAEAVHTAVLALEREADRRFNEPVVLGEDPKGTTDFWALVFLRDVLFGTRMRFEGFEVIPTGSGLGGEEELRFVNAFLREKTTTGFVFEMDQEAQAAAQRGSPAAVLHFPSLRAPNDEAVLQYCAARAETFLLAAALYRDAGGIIFDIVVGEKAIPRAQRFSVTRPYVGNLVTGGLSGEKATSVATYLQGLENSPFDHFLAGLFKEARREPNLEFQYVRYWQILELMAESMNFEPSEALLDDDGLPFLDGDRPVALKGSVANVCALLRAEDLGRAAQNWEMVNTWFAFRSAVAHYGSIAEYERLSRATTREWARRGVKQIREEGTDRFLWMLREDVKHLLTRRLVRAGSTLPASPT